MKKREVGVVEGCFYLLMCHELSQRGLAVNLLDHQRPFLREHLLGAFLGNADVV